ncbi:MAG: hypothetical protein M3Y71_07785 [Actinomycetota bacterium]|nr:hypothetical protein [Actinomycetota bacterium]
MLLENVVIDATDPPRLARFWRGLLGLEALTDEQDLTESRLSVPSGPVLDLCHPRVTDTLVLEPRLHLDLVGRSGQQEVVARALALGASYTDPSRGSAAPGAALADSEGNPFHVVAGPAGPRGPRGVG